MTIATTDRERAKADRRAALLREAARLFAARGFTGVSLEDLGTAVGVSGPAVYRHFSGKQALLGALLVGVSERLHSGGSRVIADHTDPREQLAALIQFHAHFALTESDVIRVQDRDLRQLSEEDQQAVRRFQRAYIAEWVRVLGQVRPELSTDERRLRVQAGFGLMNSTPHSVSAAADRAAVMPTLAAMTNAALLAS